MRGFSCSPDVVDVVAVVVVVVHRLVHQVVVVAAAVVSVFVVLSSAMEVFLQRTTTQKIQTMNLISNIFRFFNLRNE